LHAVTADAETLMARNLEMLVLARSVIRPDQRLVYECLDIHRLMFGDGPVAVAMRAIERGLLRRCSTIITSSPAYARHHFRERQGFAGTIKVIENKVLRDPRGGPATIAALSPAAARPPWRIGWFGMLRCTRSLALFQTLLDALPGQVEVLLAGRRAHADLPDLQRLAAATPGLNYAGAYTAADLPALYDAVHFAWCIDWFEDQANSRWLLPNRLYEGLAHHAVPIGAADTEIGRWLGEAGVGAVLADPAAALPGFLRRLGPSHYARLRRAVIALPTSRTVADASDHRALIRALAAAA